MGRKRWIFVILFITPVLLSLINPEIEMEDLDFSFFLEKDIGTSGVSVAYHDLDYDFYRHTCPQAETIARSAMARIYTQHKDVYAGLLRLFFHDCFIKGCDASVLLDDSNGNKNHSEKQAIPNQTLRNMDKIDMIKEELENACPGVVSCADTLALATRDGIALAGGPFYPLFTGRRDSARSYYQEAMAEIPKPTDNIRRTLDLFGQRGFDERETVSLLGGHNVGQISCDFIRGRLNNFAGSGKPDPSIPPDFLNRMRFSCQENNKTLPDEVQTHAISMAAKNSTKRMQFSQGLSISIPSGSTFDAHYYRKLLQGRGLLFADQQLMADENTARFVRVYASDDGTAFRRDFAKAMVKMSHLGVLTGTQGQVRTKCSFPVLSDNS